MYANSRRSQRDLRRQRRQAAADRRIGHDMAYWYEARRTATVLVPPLLAIGGAWWVWHHVDHTRIAGVVGAAGVLILVAYLAWIVRNSGTQARLMAMASGTAGRGRYWHLAGIAGALLVGAAVAIVVQQ